MRVRRTFITAIIAVTAATLAATGSASPVVGGPSFGKIAYTSFDARDKGFDVMTAGINGSDVANITHDGTAKKNVEPNWSADGMKVAFTTYYTNGGADIFVATASKKGAVNITGGPSMRRGILNIHPTWSPDGSIVFASNRDGNFDLYRIGTAKTGSLVRMTKTEAPTQNLDPDYSASGTMLAFSRTGAPTRQPTASLVTMKAVPGSPAMKLTTGAFRGHGDRGAAWSPDGKQIAFYSDRAGSSALFLVNYNGTGLRQLTESKTAADSEPSWSPDGTTLVFVSDRSSYTELWMTSLRAVSPGWPATWQITFDKQLKGSPDWQPFSAIEPSAELN